AIEEKRRKIEELNQQEVKFDGAPEFIRADIEKKKEALTGDIQAVLDQNRREALADPAKSGKSAGEAVAERLTKILGQQDGEAGNTLGSELTRTLGKEHAASMNALIDPWNTAGSASLVESAAHELGAMENARPKTTSAVWLIDTLRSFRELAKHDLIAQVRDPRVPVENKQAIGANLEAAVNTLARQYSNAFQKAYDRQRGDGRTYDGIVKSASNADRLLIEAIEERGTTDALDELRHAMDKHDAEGVKAVLRQQPNRDELDKLITAYNKLGSGRDLRQELFGRTLDGKVASVSDAEEGGMYYQHGLVTGRDAALIAEQLNKPTKAALEGKATTGLFGIPLRPGEEEANWISGGGQDEYQVTMDHRGATGHMREWTGDPETEELLKSSRKQLEDLRAQWGAEEDPLKKQHLMLEMRKLRATLSGDADAYEKDNERVLGEIRGALSFAVSIALAVAIPGAGAGLAAFLETTAINIAANVAANVVIKGGDYSLDDLKGDIVGGVLGAAGGKFGEEVLGRVAEGIT
ncbi:MAG TPA: hypothetical protein VK898_10435, partial [Chloroflexota bacterium]|nr:hypothetical protein [Chloroflexota bacterium]